MKIDTSKFKKIDCDENCTTLAHPSGHTIKIAHKGLSPELKKTLDEIPVHLAKGGRAKFAQKFDPSINPKGARPSQVAKSSDKMPGSPTMAVKAYTEPQDAGPDVVLAALNKKAPPFGPLGTDEKQHYPPCINPSCKSFGKSHPNCRCYGGGHLKEGQFAEGGKVENYCSNKNPHQEGCEYFKEGGMAGEEHHYLPELQATPGAAEELSGPTPSPAPTPAPTEDPLTQFNMTAPENLQQPEVNPNPEVPPTEQSAAPAPEESTDRAPAAIAPEPKIEQFEQHKENAKQELFPEAQAFQSDLDNGHITPETYQSLFHDKSTLGKVGTIFGLLLSGGGSAVSGQPNALMHMMDKQIDNDLQAQQNSVANKQNFLKINQDNFMKKAQEGQMSIDTKQKAYALSKAQMNYAALHKLVTDTQKLPDGPQKQQAMQTLAMMNQGVQNENFNILDRAASGAAFYKTLFGQGGNGAGEQGFQQKVGGMKMLGPQGEKRAEDMEQKHFPGIPGQASAPLSGEDKEQIGSGVEFDRQLHNYMDWAKSHSGDVNPKDIAYGKSLAAGVQGAYRQATHGGVYKEGEQNFISKIIDDDPTKFFNELRVMPKVQAVADAHKIRMDQLLKNKGFDGYKGYQGASSQGGAQTKMMNGAQYQKVNGGWQKIK